MKQTLFLLCLIASPLMAVDFEIDGLKLALSAENMALSSPLLTDNTNELMVNDAYMKDSFGIGAFSVKTIGDYTYNTIAISSPINHFSFGIGYSFSGTKDIVKTEQQGFSNEHVPVGRYAFSREHMKVSLSAPLTDSIRLGFGANYYAFTVDDDNQSGVNLSLAAQSNHDKVDISTSLINVLNQTVGPEELPLQVLAAIRFRPNDRFSVLPSIRYTYSEINYDKQQLFGIGLSYRLLKPLLLSASISQHYAGLEIKTSPRVGVTVSLLGLNCAYAFRTVDYQSKEQHYFSINLKL